MQKHLFLFFRKEIVRSEGLLTKDLVDILNELRDKRNKVVLKIILQFYCKCLNFIVIYYYKITKGGV